MPVPPGRRFGLASCVLLLTLSGCRCGASNTEPTEGEAAGEAAAPSVELGPPAGAASKELIADLEALGDRGLFVIAIRDGDWGEELAGLLSKFSEAGLADRLRSPTQLLRALAGGIDVELGPGELRGRDPTRPILISALEAPGEGPPGWVTATQPILAGSDGLRHQIVIPAQDSSALSASLTSVLGVGRAPWPELIEGRAGAQAWHLPGGMIASLPEGDRVRVVLVHSGGRSSESVEFWRGRLDNEGAPVPDTPALRQFASEAPVAVWIRPWRDRAVFANLGLIEARNALAMVAPDQRGVAARWAQQYVLGAEMMMLDEGAEFDDWAMTLSLEAGPRVRYVGSLSEPGRALMRAGTIGKVAPLKLGSEEAVAEAWFGANPIAMIAASQPPAKLAAIPTAERLRLQRDCGYGCVFHIALRAPFAGAHTLVPGLSVGSAELYGAQFVELPAKGEEARRAVAFVMSEDPGSQVGFIRQLGLDGGGPGGEFETALLERDGKSILVLSQGVSPREVFDLGDAGPGDPSLLFDARLGPGGAFGQPAELDELLGRLGPMQLQVRVQAKAVAVDLRFGPANHAIFNPDFSAASWDSPLRASPASFGEACLVEALRQIHSAFETLQEVAPSQRTEAMAEALSGAGAALDCAETDPVTGATGVALRALLIDTIAATYLSELDYDAALETYEQGCQVSANATWCARRDALRGQPKPRLATLSGAQTCLTQVYDELYLTPGTLPRVALEVAAEGVRFIDEILPLEGEAIAEAIADQLGPHARREGKLDDVPITLVVDRELPLAKLSPVLEALGALGYARVSVAIEAGEPLERYALPLATKLGKSFEVELEPLDPALLESLEAEWLEEEPPPETEDAKSELYALRKSGEVDGREASMRVEIRLTGDDVALEFDGNKREYPIELLGSTAESWDRQATRVELQVSPQTTWAQLSATLGELCPHEVTLTWAPN